MESKKSIAHHDAIRTKKPWLLVLVTLLFTPIASLAVDPIADAKPERFSVGAETYTEPKLGRRPNLSYPSYEQGRGEEGWVFVQMMIDPKGKPYEIEVLESTGNTEFEKAALKAISSTKFEPATLGGKPIDATVVIPIIFAIPGNKAVTPAFATALEALTKAMEQEDRWAAEQAVSKLNAKNLYESALLGLAKFHMAKQWGSDEEQLKALGAAVGGMTTPKYLPYEAFTYALQNLFLVQVKLRHYESALSTWKILEGVEKDPKVIERYKTVAASVEAARTDARPFSVLAAMPEGVWAHRLFRSKFAIRVLEGHVSQIKLYCEKKYVLFLFDPLLEYKVEDKFGKCSMVVLGDGGTKIELIQKN